MYRIKEKMIELGGKRSLNNWESVWLRLAIDAWARGDKYIQKDREIYCLLRKAIRLESQSQTASLVTYVVLSMLVGLALDVRYGVVSWRFFLLLLWHEVINRVYFKAHSVRKNVLGETLKQASWLIATEIEISFIIIFDWIPDVKSFD